VEFIEVWVCCVIKMVENVGLYYTNISDVPQNLHKNHYVINNISLAISTNSMRPCNKTMMLNRSWLEIPMCRCIYKCWGIYSTFIFFNDFSQKS
jgi:hypothetical protein